MAHTRLGTLKAVSFFILCSNYASQWLLGLLKKKYKMFDLQSSEPGMGHYGDSDMINVVALPGEPAIRASTLILLTPQAISLFSL